MGFHGLGGEGKRCAMEEGRISYHESVRLAYERLRRDGMTNVWDRYEAQGMGGDPDQRCTFCSAGVRCDLCSNGPCRADVEKGKRGVCGITGDGMAMRMMLLRNVLGASTYQYHAEETLRTLKHAVQNGGPFAIRDPHKLRSFGTRFNIPDMLPDEEFACELIAYFERDFYRRYDEESHTVLTLAPTERLDTWRSLGLLPGGIHGEVMLCTSSCLTNVDGYYRSLASKALRLAIATAYQSQIVNEYLQDTLFGTPYPHEIRLDLGVLDPDYVNIVPNGHEPFLGFALVEAARKAKWQERARKAGAKGVRIVGSIETGQEMVHRWMTDDILYGFAGNWLMQEALLATGCIDLIACDMNCSMPIDPLFAERYRFRLVPASPLVSFEGVTDRIDYDPRQAEEQAEMLIEMAIENFPERRQAVEPLVGLPTRIAIAGFSPESIMEVFGGDGSLLLRALKEGIIRGIAGLVSCTSLRDKGQDVHTVRVTKKLVEKDVLVLAMGCGNAGLQLAGLCSKEAGNLAGPRFRGLLERLDIPPVLSFGTCTDTGRFADFVAYLSSVLDLPIPSLPIVFVAPEYMEQKATIDAIFSLAFGLFTYVNPVPPITGAPNLLRLLKEGLLGLTGAALCLEKDPDRAVEAILSHIEEKRENLPSM
jgi:carbon-monoxide dehydrogenase catalytic subunit